MTWIEARTDNEGRLHVSGLRPGTYRVGIRSLAGPSAVLEPLEVAEGAVLSLGTIELRPPGDLLGRVLAPAGAAMGGLVVSCNDQSDWGRERRSARTDPSGSFRFESLPRGTYSLQVKASEELGESARVLVSVGDGPLPKVTLDLREQGHCGLDLEFVFDVSSDEELLMAYLVPVGSPDSASLGLGSLGAPRGRIERSFRAIGEAHVWVRTQGGILFRCPEPLDLRFKGRVQRRIELPSGSLAVELPEGRPFPMGWTMNLRLHPRDGAEHVPPQELAILAEPRRSRGREPGSAFDEDAGTLRLSLVPAGAYRLEVELVDPGATWEQLGTCATGEPVWGRRPAWSAECSVSVPRGGEGCARLE